MLKAGVKINSSRLCKEIKTSINTLYEHNMIKLNFKTNRFYNCLLVEEKFPVNIVSFSDRQSISTQSSLQFHEIKPNP